MTLSFVILLVGVHPPLSTLSTTTRRPANKYWMGRRPEKASGERNPAAAAGVGKFHSLRWEICDLSLVQLDALSGAMDAIRVSPKYRRTYKADTRLYSIYT